MEPSMGVPQKNKIKVELPDGSAISRVGIQQEEIEISMSKSHLHMRVHLSTGHKSQETESTCVHQLMSW